MVGGAIAHPAATSEPKALPPPSPPSDSASPLSPRLEDVVERMRKLERISQPQMVLIGVSTGGPNALAEVLPQLPPDLNVPVFVVQHMPAMFTQPLAESLAAKCRLAVKEAVHGEFAQPNVVYIAPGGKQMRIGAAPGGQILVQITEDPPENNCRPSVDYLFRSSAHAFPGQALAVIMTGMGNDGTLGLKLLKRHSCFSIVQSEETCVVFGMPKSAIEAGLADVILPLAAIGPRITAAVKGN